MSCLYLFAWHYSSCKKCEARIAKWNILASSGTRPHDQWIAKPPPSQWAYKIYYNIDTIELNQCAIYKYIITSDSVLCIKYIQYCSHIPSVLCCCFENTFFWSNSKIIHNKKYVIWLQYGIHKNHSVARYEIVINNTH